MKTIAVEIKRLERSDAAADSYCCMTELPTPWPRALCLCREWMAANLGRYVEGYHLALDGRPAGHLYYALSQNALFAYDVEPDTAILYCEWVQRRHQGQGLGRRLFDTFREDMERAGIKGILVEATNCESRMHHRHFTRRGFRALHETEHHKLLYLPLAAEAVRVQCIAPRVRPRAGEPVEILVVRGYMCPYEISTLMALQRVAREFGERVALREVELSPETLREYGVSRGFFVNGKAKLSGAEPEEAIRDAIREEFAA